MTVIGLVQELLKCDPSLPVKCYWESAIRSEVDIVSDKFNPNYVVLFDSSDISQSDRDKLEDIAVNVEGKHFGYKMIDGIDHINIYSKGQTELGRWMSNFAYSPITTEDGQFTSIEGYWYWLITHHDELRTMWGYKAKQFGKMLIDANIPSNSVPEDFQDKIRKAIILKARSNPKMLHSLQNTNLPLKHYYVYGTKTVHPGYQWITDIWEEIRSKQFENTGIIQEEQ